MNDADLIADFARNGATLGNQGRMCKDCAFRPETITDVPGEHAVQGALSRLLMGGRMNCHTDDHEDANKPCTGFLYAKAWCDHLDNVH